MDSALVTWLVDTLRAYPELAVFFALAVGFAVGPWKLGGFTLGNVTATLLAGVLIGQLGITVDGPIKSAFFLLFLFAVGYGVGPQFFRGLGKEGPRQIVFSLVVLVVCLVVPVLCAMAAGLDVGYAAGLYAGSQTISAAIGVSTDQIARLGLSPEQAKAYADAVPIGYAVTYLFGTIGSAIVLAQIGPKLIGVDLQAACAEYERQMGADASAFDPGAFSAYRAIELRAYRVDHGSPLVGPRGPSALPGRAGVHRARAPRQRLPGRARRHRPPPRRRHRHLRSAPGPRGRDREACPRGVRRGAAQPAGDRGRRLRDQPGTFSGKTLRELADEPFARGVYLKKITRQMVELPILPESEILRGDILTLGGAVNHVNAAVDALGVPDHPLDSTDLMTVAGGILLGGLIGALSVNWRGVPLSLSTSGGALLAGLVLGYLRTMRPTFGRIPTPALVLMNTLGLNVFIAIVGINAGPGFVAGVQQVGVSLFIWGAVATTVPLVFGILLGHFVFKFHPAILFGAVAGVRTTTAALGMLEDAAKSKVPAIGYGMPYAVGNTLLTIFGMAVVLWMSR